MDTVTYETLTIQRPFHTITCDDCGKELAKSFEDDEGCFDEPSIMKYDINLDNKRYSINKTLCNECREKYETKLINVLHELGFTVKEN